MKAKTLLTAIPALLLVLACSTSNGDISDAAHKAATTKSPENSSVIACSGRSLMPGLDEIAHIEELAWWSRK